MNSNPECPHCGFRVDSFGLLDCPKCGITVPLRTHLLDPIPQIYEAARLLDDAVTAHLAGDRDSADRLIRATDLPVIAYKF